MTREDFNSVKLIGRLGQDPEHSIPPSGVPTGGVATVSIAVGGGEKKDGGKWPTHWINLKAFGDVGVALADVKKGTEIQLKGELRQESWEKDGVKKNKLVVVVREFEQSPSIGLSNEVESSTPQQGR